MNYLQAVILGILQGAAEFIPISSSGHLVVFGALMGLEDIPVLFDVLLHVATLLVVLLVFRQRIAGITIALLRWMGRRSTEADKPYLFMALLILIATVITVAFGLPISNLNLKQYPQVASALFLVTAVILLVGSRLQGNRDMQNLKWKDSWITGLAQGLGVLPGISRSGITITAAQFAGMDRATAGEFSFLMSIPAIVGATILEFRHLDELSAQVNWAVLGVAFLTTFVVGYLALNVLMKLVKGGKLHWFALYLVPLGIAGLVFFR